MINLLTTSLTTVVAIWMAWAGYGVWSLVATDVVAAVILIVGFYLYRPVWTPRLGWNPASVRYFFTFGSRSFLAGLLLQALDRVDDLWTGYALGEGPLGFYSRAYTFATYPRRVLAAPINAVASGTYAELKGQTKRLSQAFFRVNAFLVRTGFLFAGLLTLVAPEFIRILLGVKWLPMLTAFRLMLVFTMLDPIKGTVASLFVAVGSPEKTVRARAVQLVVLIAGLLALGPFWGIAGVALAVDIMLLVGIALLLWQAMAYVRFSVLRLFAAPALGLFSGIILARAAILIPGVLGSPWRTGGVKIVVFSLIYLGVLLLLERDLIPMSLTLVRQLRTSDRF
jgi:O-antigen/teichoic acid export membrane protein